MPPSLTIIAVDPGRNGATVIRNDGHLEVVIKHLEVFASNESLSPLATYAELIVKHAYGDRVMIVREAASSRRGNSSKSTWSFAYGIGRVDAAIELALGSRAVYALQYLPTPKTWMTAMDCLTGGDKNITKTKAAAMFPSLKVTHATADALLISEYAERFLK